MTVRVNKQPFNLREKLSELEKPIGVKGSELMRSETAQEARDFVSAGRKNMVINGDMRISQRVGTTSTNIANGGYLIDRFRWDTGTSGQMTAQQVTDSPPGFYNSMKLTVTTTDTSIAAGDYHYFRHIIEGNNINHLNWGSSNAKTVTLSFWVRSSITGTHGGSLWNNNFNRCFPFDYSINSADTWEHKSITIPGCPDGTWEAGTGRGIAVAFTQLSGSTYTGPPHQWNGVGDIAPTTHVNLLATSGATWYITGIQLEVGKNATDFEYRSYGEELALCQRYYQKFNAAFNLVNAYPNVSLSSGNQLPSFPFPVPMRTAPSMSPTTVTTSYDKWNASGSLSREVRALASTTQWTFQYYATDNGNTNLPSGGYHRGQTTEGFAFNAEL